MDAFFQQPSSEKVHGSSALPASARLKQTAKDIPEQAPEQAGSQSTDSEQKFSSHLTRKKPVAEKNASAQSPDTRSSDVQSPNTQGGIISKPKGLASSQAAQPQDSQESTAVQPVSATADLTQAKIAQVSPVKQVSPVEVSASEVGSNIGQNAEAITPVQVAVDSGDAEALMGAQDVSAKQVQGVVRSAVQESAPVVAKAGRFVARPEAAQEAAGTASSGAQQSETASVGVVVSRNDPSADLSPIILVKSQVVRLSVHLQTLGVTSPQPEVIAHAAFSEQRAIEIYGLVSAISSVAGLVAMGEHGGFVSLPPEALESLELVIELQNLLDKDSFSALFGYVPTLSLATPEQTAQALQENKNLSPDGVLVFVQPAPRPGPSLAYTPVMHADGTAAMPDRAADSAAAKSALPEWLHEAASPSSAQFNYGAVRSAVSHPWYPQVQVQTQSQLDVQVEVQAQPQPQPQSVTVSETVPQGAALRQRLDQQAAQYMQTQRHTLPRHLQRLTQMPMAGSAEYPAWVEEVAQMINQAGFTHLNATDGSGGAATYVFEEREVTRLLHMLPVTALRDVVRGAGKLSRRLSAQDALVRSQGTAQQMQLQSQQLQQSLHAAPEAADAHLEVQTEIHRSNASSHVAPNTAAAIVPSLATASPTTANRAAERDVRALARKRADGSYGSVADKFAADGTQQQTERGDAYMRSLDAQQRAPEAESLRQAQATVAETFEVAPATQKPTNSAQQAAQVQRQEQLMRIAKHIRAQVTMQVLRQAQTETDTVELQLNPRRLGKISIQLVREASSKMVINFAIENPDTLEALRNNVDDLLQSLREAGISTDRGAMNFTLKEENRQTFEQKQKKNTVSDGLEDEEEALLAMGQLADIDDDGHVNVRV